MDTLVLLTTVLAGLAVLFFGRQLFWLFVAVVGFLVGFEVARDLLANDPLWLQLVVALAAGVVGAVLAYFLQYAAVAVAGFFAGGYLVLVLLRVFSVAPSQFVLWLLVISAGVLAAVVVLLLFDWALIVLSSMLGAAALLDVVTLDAGLTAVLFVILAAIGIAVQGYLYTSRGETTRVRRVRS
ncbi:MAG: DUF4203 domain-containing protein [Candidatus Promineifilaceae bacterium]|nr:DUF4203 domain-containing protein [Candidatus Promineifilaceae bacterium]